MFESGPQSKDPCILPMYKRQKKKKKIHLHISFNQTLFREAAGVSLLTISALLQELLLSYSLIKTYFVLIEHCLNGTGIHSMSFIPRSLYTWGSENDVISAEFE